MAISLRPLVASALILGVLSADPVSAFEYYEHRRATEHVLDELCQKPFGAKHVCQARKALLTVMHESDKRLLAGDLVAIAGDHAVSPPSMVWRFFIGRRGKFYLPNLNVLHGESPENVDQSAIDLERFLDTIEALAPPTEQPEKGWRQCAHDRKAVYDKEMMGSAASFVDAAKAADVKSIGSLFSEKLRTARLLPKPPVDPNYIANAAHNASHFRIPAGVSDEQLWARAYYRLRSDPQGRPSRNKPALHAISYYGDLHTGALVLMRAAKKAKRQRRKDLLAASLILELFALHYLQDGVSAGHLGGEAVHNLGYPSFFLRHDSDRVASAGSLLDASRRKSLHDTGNVDGRRVVVSVEAGRAMCGSKAKKKVTDEELFGAAELHRLFGDGAMLCGSDESQPWMTRALVEAVTRASLQELDEAYKDKRLDKAAPQILDKPEAFKAVTPCDLEVPPDDRKAIHRVHTLTCQWWESHPQKLDEKALAIRRAVAAGYFETMNLLPLPAHDDGMYAHSQAALVEGVDRQTFCRRRGYR